MTVSESIAELVAASGELQSHLDAAGAAFRRLSAARADLARAGRAEGLNAAKLDAQPDVPALLDGELRRLGLVPVPSQFPADSSLAESVQGWANRFQG